MWIQSGNEDRYGSIYTRVDANKAIQMSEAVANKYVSSVNPMKSSCDDRLLTLQTPHRHYQKESVNGLFHELR